MLPGLFFIVFRLLELCFLIPVLGMLSSIVHGYVTNNELAPSFVLVLFIVVVIASVWALFSTLFYAITKHHGYFIALIDFLIFGGLIGGVVVLGVVNHLDCSDPNLRNPAYLLSGPFLYQFGSFCNLLKASFALGILLIILFFFTTLIALWVHHHHRYDNDNRSRNGDRREVTETQRRHHSSRNGSRSRNTSRSRNPDSRRERDGRGNYRRGDSQDRESGIRSIQGYNGPRG